MGQIKTVVWRSASGNFCVLLHKEERENLRGFRWHKSLIAEISERGAEANSWEKKSFFLIGKHLSLYWQVRSEGIFSWNSFFLPIILSLLMYLSAWTCSRFLLRKHLCIKMSSISNQFPSVDKQYSYYSCCSFNSICLIKLDKLVNHLLEKCQLQTPFFKDDS